MSPFRFEVGAVTVYAVPQFRFVVDPSWFFDRLESPEFDPRAWYWQPPFIDAETGFLAISMGGFLVLTPTQKILIDAGIGNGKSRPNPQFDGRSEPWLQTLAELGAPAEEIDTVVFTHLHVDHVGYATTLTDGQWRPTFPHARYLSTEPELAFWTGAASQASLDRLGNYITDSIAPLQAAGRLDLVAPDHEITPEVRLSPAYGHTPGNVCVEINSEGRRAIFSGDMIHHPVQLAFPEWSTSYCIDGQTATTSRLVLLDEVADSDTLLVPAHFPGSVPGHVTSRGVGYFWEPLSS